jgi:hypothetical protein
LKLRLKILVWLERISRLVCLGVAWPGGCPSRRFENEKTAAELGFFLGIRN